MDHLIAGLPENIRNAEARGELRLAGGLIDRALRGSLPSAAAARLRFEKERLERLRAACPHDRKAALRILRGRLRGFRNSELDDWIRAGFVSPRTIEGRERFTDSFASNVVFCKPALRRRLKAPDKAAEAGLEKMLARAEELARGAKPARYRVRARITLTLKKKPGGSVRCWLPFPRVGDQVSAARLVAASHDGYRLAAPGAPQRTIFFEDRSRKFYAEFEYVISEWVTRPGKGGRVPPGAAKYLREEPPHIVLSPYVRGLAAEITGKERDPYLKARRIYDWLTRNFTYNFTPPYCLFENISGEALASLRGDCGFQALAFIALCRAAGVPAKWQSGWIARPDRGSPHDWALFYAGGWRPADLSFGNKMAAAGRERLRRFYFGCLDAGRMVANAGFGSPFRPPKKFWRSDPADNQLGEAETRSRNLYYGEFATKIKVISFERMS